MAIPDCPVSAAGTLAGAIAADRFHEEISGIATGSLAAGLPPSFDTGMASEFASDSPGTGAAQADSKGCDACQAKGLSSSAMSFVRDKGRLASGSVRAGISRLLERFRLCQIIYYLV